MEGVISYRPGMGKSKLEVLVKKKLHYKSVNQFIDQAVTRALHNEIQPHSVASKIAHEVEKAVLKYVPLKFTKASAGESKEIARIVKRTDRSKGWVSAEQVMKKHNIG